MGNIKNNVAAQDTKRRLIEAAGEVFAEHGFERATIKDITERAGASLAAVNYHFSDKHELYYQVVRHAHECCHEPFDSLKQSDPATPPCRRLKDFIRLFLRNMLDPNRPAWHGILLAREIQQPSAAIQRVIEEVMRPSILHLEQLVTDLAGGPPPLPRRQMILFIDSIISQCLFQVDHCAIHDQLYPDLPPANERLEELTEHIASFSIAGIRGMMQRP